MIVAAMLLQAAAPAVDCARQLCLKGHRLTALPDQGWRCGDAAGRDFTIGVAGPPRVHERPARIVAAGLKLPGVADNRYAPFAIDIGGVSSIVENFVAGDAKALYYITLSVKLDRLLDAPTGEQDVAFRTATYQITRGAPDRMAKPFATGTCTPMDMPTL